LCSELKEIHRQLIFYIQSAKSVARHVRAEQAHVRSANRGSRKMPTMLQSVFLPPKQRALVSFVLVVALPMGLRVLSVPQVARHVLGQRRMIALSARQGRSHSTEPASRRIRMVSVKGQV
jgi:hypothetical protein